MEEKYIQSIERASKIIDCFTEECWELSLAEISQKVMLHKSTTFGIVRTLEHEGYLIQNKETKAYRLSMKFITKGLYASSSVNILKIADAGLQRLNNKYHMVTALFLLENNILRCVSCYSSMSVNSIKLKTELGAELPNYITASSQVTLAHSSPQQQKRLLDGDAFHLYLKESHQTEQDYIKLLNKIQEQQYALEFELDQGLMSIATVIYDYKDVIGTISITGSVSQINNQLTSIKKDMILECKLISKQLGNVEVAMNE